MRRIGDGGQGQMSQRAVEILLARLEIEISGSVLAQRAWKGINKNGERPVRPRTSIYSVYSVSPVYYAHSMPHIPRHLISPPVDLCID
jgi:hypothetical protein